MQTKNLEDPIEFQEQLFPIATGRDSSYQLLVDQGKDRMKLLDVAIIGLARNIADVVHLTTARIERLGKMFNSYSVVIYESDSNDATRMALAGWETVNRNVHITGTDHGDPIHPQTRDLGRMVRMAYYRNQLRTQVVDLLGDCVSHVIVVDTDLPGGWSYNGVAHTFAFETWDFVGANGIKFSDYGLARNKPLYFDVWAFRWPGSDKPCRPEDINPRYWFKGAPLQPVNSCFGGLGCYRIDAMKRCAYDGTDCEHASFHRRMRDNGMGRLFMNPAQLTLY